MKSILIAVAAIAISGCASNGGIMANASSANRNLAQVSGGQNISTELQTVNLADVISASSGYWSVSKGAGASKTDFYGRYRAYIVAKPNADYNDLYVFAESSPLADLPVNKNKSILRGQRLSDVQTATANNEFNLIAKNSNFVWGGSFGGTEPTLTTNKKNSLVIQSMNEGIGRTAWNEQVIARFNPETGKIEVIGYEYISYDKIDGSGNKCSLNYNTGRGVVTTTPVSIDADGNEIKHAPDKAANVKVPNKPLELNEWKSNPDSPYLAPCLK